MLSFICLATFLTKIPQICMSFLRVIFHLFTRVNPNRGLWTVRAAVKSVPIAYIFIPKILSVHLNSSDRPKTFHLVLLPPSFHSKSSALHLLVFPLLISGLISSSTTTVEKGKQTTKHAWFILGMGEDLGSWGGGRKCEERTGWFNPYLIWHLVGNQSAIILEMNRTGSVIC